MKEIDAQRCEENKMLILNQSQLEVFESPSHALFLWPMLAPQLQLILAIKSWCKTTFPYYLKLQN